MKDLDLYFPLLCSSGIQPFPACPVYAATKFGVVGFTRSIALASTARSIRNTTCK